MIFTAAQIRAIRQGKQTATLAPTTERARAGSVRVLRRCDVTAQMARRPARAGPARDVLAFVDARLDLDPTVEVVCDTSRDGDRVPVLVTVLAVQDVDVGALTLQMARACGWRTSGQLRAAWAFEHPRMTRARLVSFALGDTRDAPVLISAGWPDYTHDPGRAMRGEPEPVSRGEHARLAADAQQRFARFQADRGRAAASASVSERLQAIQAGTVAQPDLPA
jgi:hypothetical protein